MNVLAVLALAVHLSWLALLIFGAFWTRRRPLWSALHILALLWGIVAEVGPWPCPLTLAEQYFEARAGRPSYQGGFLLHSLDAIVYPNLPYWIVASAGVAVCALNLGIYCRRFRMAWALSSKTPCRSGFPVQRSGHREKRPQEGEVEKGTG